VPPDDLDSAHGGGRGEPADRPVRTWSLPLRTGIFALMVSIPVGVFFPAAVTPAAAGAAGLYLWLDVLSRRRRARHRPGGEDL
jgi:hypothetical protein